MKFSSVDFHEYAEWQKHILHSRPVIPKDCRRPVLMAFCFALASHGSTGMDCYAGDSLLAEELGIHRKYLSKYRRLAIELGWFAPNGRKVNRVDSLDIAIPQIQRDVPKLAEDAPKVAEVPAQREPEAPKVDPWATDADLAS